MLKRVQHDGLRDGSKHETRASASNRRQAQIDGQIQPLRVFGFYQVNLPPAVPVFQLFLASNRIHHVIEHFKTNETVNRIFGGIAGRQIMAMLVEAFQQIRRHTNIQRAIRFARQYIDARLLGFSHSQFIGSPWILKQVQDDAFRGIGRY